MWWVDPCGALVICAYVVATWTRVGGEAAEAAAQSPASRVVPAHPDFIEAVRRLAGAMDVLRVADVRAYHAPGTRNVVEMDVVMNGRTALATALQASQALRKRVEALPGVELAHVHLDYVDVGEPEAV